jgi:hypothetical protein
MNGHDYTVQFRIFSKTLDPAKITLELDLQPCQIKREGDIGVGRRWQEGMWAFDGGEGSIEWESLEDGITFVLDKLWSRREAIAKYKASAKLIWWCGNFQYSFDGGPCLSADLLKRLGEFGADLYIDNHFVETDEEEQPEG